MFDSCCAIDFAARTCRVREGIQDYLSSSSSTISSAYIYIYIISSVCVVLSEIKEYTSVVSPRLFRWKVKASRHILWITCHLLLSPDANLKEYLKQEISTHIFTENFINNVNFGTYFTESCLEYKGTCIHRACVKIINNILVVSPFNSKMCCKWNLVS